MATYSPLVNESVNGEADIETPTPPTARETQKSEITQATMVVSVPATAVSTPSTTLSDRCTVTSCCCGCSLPTGIRILAGLDVFYAFNLLVYVVSSIYLKINEKKIDGYIEDSYEEEEASQGLEQQDANEAQPVDDDFDLNAMIKRVNLAIDLNAMMTPMYAILLLLYLHFACKGFKAARGDIAAARSYYKWRVALVFWALISSMLTANLLVMLCTVGLQFYFACVTKSHYINLVTEEPQRTSPTAPATLVIVGEAI